MKTEGRWWVRAATRGLMVEPPGPSTLCLLQVQKIQALAFLLHMLYQIIYVC